MESSSPGSTRGWRVGIDTGGTFTDIVAVRDGEIRIGKVPSTPPAFERGVLDAIGYVGLELGDIGELHHGTTATTNAVITRTGAQTGLVTTRGFRDVLELRRHNRGELYDILWDPPQPLAPRRRRLEVSERIDYAGQVLEALDEDDLRAALARLKESNVESVAVCFLNAYQNPTHEQKAREVIAAVWPEAYVSISSDLLREPQEFERTSTTVMNAYLGPILSGYVERLSTQLTAGGYPGQLKIMHSGGGLLPAESCTRVPARTVTSGPAAGVMAAEGISESIDVPGIISLDMGGTSADIAVVRSGRARLVEEYEPEPGLPIRFPTIDLLTIGAGGGSIAWVDAAGLPHVGPQSAGAMPGPACYARGGNQATVTDANLFLGRLAPETKLGGGLTLDLALANAAIERFAHEARLEREESALGIIDIANSNMARAIRVMTVERGLDPRQFALLAFGGAGPMHACELADRLAIREVIVPSAPGVTSALGTLYVDVVHDRARSHIVPIVRLDPEEVERAFRELERDVNAALSADHFPAQETRIERSVDLRYIGQIKTLNLPVANQPFDTDSVTRVCADFLVEYEQRYHYATGEIPLELSVIRVRGRGLHTRPNLAAPPTGSQPKVVGTREVTFRSDRVTAEIYRRDDFTRDTSLAGPLIVEQDDSTTVVPRGWHVSVDTLGDLRLTKE